MGVLACEYECLTRFLVAWQVPLLALCVSEEGKTPHIVRRNQVAWQDLSTSEYTAVAKDERMAFDRMADGFPETVRDLALIWSFSYNVPWSFGVILLH